jgi:inosine/xanthosine triphosphatase
MPSKPAPARITPRVALRVGSTNPAKLQPVKEVAKILFGAADVIGVEIPSGVSAQPLSEQETVRGALERARDALLSGAADYGVGIEGGIATVGGMWFGFTWVAVVDPEGRTGLASSARYPLPARIGQAVLGGRELAEVVDEVAGTRGIGRREGMMGLLTRGRVTRASATAQALHFAFSRFLAPEGLRDD